MGKFNIKYKLREGDTYENLVQRFGPNVLTNAGIYGDEDLVNNKEFTLTTDTREEAELLLRKDLEYQRDINKAIRLRNAKNFDDFWELNGQDILIRYGYDRGKDKQYAEDLKESLRLRYIQGENSVELLIADANKKELDFWDGTYANKKRLEQLLKMLHNIKEIQKQWDSLRFTKGDSLSNPGGFQFGYNADLYNLNEPLANVKYLELVEKELGRKLTDLERQHLGLHAEDYLNFVKLGKGKTYLDYLKYLEGEHKSAESTRDLAKKAGYGIVGAAAAMPLLANPAGLAHLTRQAATTAVKHAPGMIRDAIVYEKAIDPATTAIADAAGLEGTSRAIFKNGLGFGFSGLGSKVMDRGIIAGLQKLRNSLDDLASRGGIMGKQITDLMGRNFTKAANAVENVQNQATKVMDPLRTLNAKEAMYDSASAFTKNALAGTAYGVVEEESPLGAAVVAPLTSIGLSKATHGIKRLGWLNSRGAQEAKIIKDTMGEKVAPYTMIYDTTSKTNRQYNGKLVAKRGLLTKGGAQDVMHTPNGEIPLMHKWTSIHKGNTYKSPYWEEVNPQRFMASKMMAPYEGTGWMNRRSYGDTMDFFSPLSYDEFAQIAKTSYNKDGLSMYNYLKLDKLKYDLKFNGKDPLGDLIIGKNTNKGIATGSKSDAERLVGYNQKGNRLSAELFTTPEGTLIHLGSDFGGTGSGGSSDVLNRGFIPWLVGRAKASMDLGAYSMPVTGQIQRAKLVNKGKKFSSANVEAYHKNGLPEVDIALAQRKKFHFKNGGIIPNVYGL